MTKKDLLKVLLSDIQNVIPAEEGFKYSVDHNSFYGGYRLVLVKTKTGGHYGCFGGNGCEARLPYKQFIQKIRTILATVKELEYV